MSKTKTKVEPIEWWPCACVRRDRAGNLAKIKLNGPTIKRCRKCGCKRPIFPHYRCKHCGKVVERQSGKKWLKSTCEETGREVRLQRVSEGSWSFRLLQEVP